MGSHSSSSMSNAETEPVETLSLFSPPQRSPSSSLSCSTNGNSTTSNKGVPPHSPSRCVPAPLSSYEVYLNQYRCHLYDHLHQLKQTLSFVQENAPYLLSLSWWYFPMDLSSLLQDPPPPPSSSSSSSSSPTPSVIDPSPAGEAGDVLPTPGRPSLTSPTGPFLSQQLTVASPLSSFSASSREGRLHSAGSNSTRDYRTPPVMVDDSVAASFFPSPMSIYPAERYLRGSHIPADHTSHPQSHNSDATSQNYSSTSNGMAHSHERSSLSIEDRWTLTGRYGPLPFSERVRHRWTWWLQKALAQEIFRQSERRGEDGLMGEANASASTRHRLGHRGAAANGMSSPQHGFSTMRRMSAAGNRERRSAARTHSTRALWAQWLRRPASSFSSSPANSRASTWSQYALPIPQRLRVSGGRNSGFIGVAWGVTWWAHRFFLPVGLVFTVMLVDVLGPHLKAVKLHHAIARRAEEQLNLERTSV